LKENIASTLGTNPGDDVPVYDMPHLFDHTSRDQPSEQVSNMRKKFRSCVKLSNDKNYLQVLQSILEKCNSGEEAKLEQNRVNQVCKKRRKSREFRLNEKIGDFNMRDIILDLGSEVNFIHKNTWEAMGEPILGYSPIALKIEKQHRVVKIGILKGIPVDLDGVPTMEDFEVIDMVDNTSPYLALLGLD
jgi:hypothetical protein